MQDKDPARSKRVMEALLKMRRSISKLSRERVRKDEE